MESSNEDRRIVILYGTQTGCAQEVAERIGREAERFRFTTYVESLSAIEMSLLLKEKLILFVVSTTGQGEFPDNMKDFWKLLMAKSVSSPTLLEHLQFGVFGLGDSSYTYFNIVAKKLFKRLTQLGARSIIRRGEGDDQHEMGLDGALNPWLEELWNILLKEYPLPPNTTILPKDHLPPPKFEVKTLAPSAVTTAFSPKTKRRLLDANIKKYSPKHPFYAKLIQNTRLTSTDWTQDVRHIVLDITGSGITYVPGDVAYIAPRNTPEDAAAFIRYLGYDPAMVIDIKPSGSTTSHAISDIPLPNTLQEIIEGYYDIMGTPRRYFFELLSHFATLPLHKEKLKELASVEGMQDLKWYNFDAHRTLFQVLKDFDSVKIPLEYLFEVLPRIQARPFSIASSLRAHPNQIHLTVAIVKFETTFKQIRKGVCSSWLASLDPANDVYVPLWIQSHAYAHLPKDPTVPLILIGPGTGCAMFKAILEEKLSLSTQGIASGRNLFFFGCRHRAKDYLHESAWKMFQSSGVAEVITAFSRDQPHKVYVFHKLTERAAEIWELVQQGAVIYVSGSAGAMPKLVKRTFVEIFQAQGALSELHADELLRQLEKSNRYKEETWS